MFYTLKSTTKNQIRFLKGKALGDHLVREVNCGNHVLVLGEGTPYLDRQPSYKRTWVDCFQETLVRHSLCSIDIEFVVVRGVRLPLQQ